MPCIGQRWGLRERIYVNSIWPLADTQNMVKNFYFLFLMTVIVTVVVFLKCIPYQNYHTFSSLQPPENALLY